MRTRLFIVAGLAACSVLIGPRGHDANLWAAPGTARSEEDFRLVAEQFVQAVVKGDFAAVEKLIDWDAIFDAAAAGVDATPEFREGFEAGVRKTLNSELGLSHELHRKLEGGGSLRLLRMHGVQGRTLALVRLLPAQGELNYYDLILARRSDGVVCISDIYILSSTESISQRMHRYYAGIAASQSDNASARGPAAGKSFAQNLPKIEQLTTAYRQGHFEKTLELYRQLPPTLLRDKNLMLLRVQAAQRISPAEYRQAVQALRTEFSDDPGVDLVSLDYYLHQSDLPQALACADRIDAWVGGDPYLGVVRANVYLEQGNVQAAQREATAAARAEPECKAAYWTLVAITLEQRNFSETVRLLRVLEEQLQVQLADLTQIAAYREFVKSPEYARWSSQATAK